MTLDGFLTFLALVVAIYAIVSRSRVNKLRLRLGITVQIPLAVLTFVIVLYLAFFPLVRFSVVALGGSCEWLPFPTGEYITPQKLSFLVVLCWMCLAWGIHRFLARPRSSSSLPTISKIVDEFVYEQRFAEVMDLVKPYLPLIGQAANRKLRLQKLHDKIKCRRSNGLQVLLHPEAQRNAFSKKLRRWVSYLAVLVPHKRQAETAARNLVRPLFLSIELRNHIVQRRPYFGISLLKLEVHEKGDFSHEYFTDLISNTGSVLYEELKQDWNGPYDAGHRFSESNRLLYFLFNDPRTAKELSVWKPIGEYLLKLLRADESPSPDFLARLNKATEDFEEERWEYPFYAGIYFFELMVTSAALKGVRWHMWLFYLPLFVERLEEIYDTSDYSVNPSAEFPTRSARLIYEALCTLREWVLLASKLPPDSPHKQFGNLPGVQGQRWRFYFSGNNNIPVSAAVALGSCMGTIALSNRLGEEFACYMYEVILRAIKRLGYNKELDQLRVFLIQSIVHGGQNQINHEYGNRLIKLGSKVDSHLWSDVRDLGDALDEKYS